MNLLDVLRQDKNYRLGEKIESYGRSYITVSGKTVENQAALSIPEIKDVVDFKRWDYPEDKLDYGCLTYLEGEEYPMRSCNQNDRCVALHQVKRLIPVMARTLKNPIGIIYFILNWEKYLEYIHFSLRDVYYKDPKFYSQPVAEIYWSIKNEKIRDIICAVLEFDNGYRFPFQDIFSELDVVKFNRNPIKEMKRLFEMLVERSNGYFSGKVSKNLSLIINLLWLRPGLVKEIKNIVNKIDIGEILFSTEDIYWTKRLPSSYQFNYEKYDI